MLFDRFVFVLYLLLGYTWFLLGTVYDTDYRYVSIVSMMLSLVCVIVVTLMQLQILLRQNALPESDKWSTIAWSTQHILLCAIFCVDGLQWTNAVVVLGMCGLLMSVTIAIVMSCACFVIMQNGHDWHAHVHLTCVTFWVMIQYMCVRLPTSSSTFITCVPIVLMACVRMFEKIRVAQMLLWLVAILLHVLRDTGNMNQMTFLYTLTVVVGTMSFVHRRVLLTLVIIPIALVPGGLYVLLRLCCGRRASASVVEIIQLYNEITAKDLEPIVLPMDEEYAGENWNETL